MFGIINRLFFAVFINKVSGTCIHPLPKIAHCVSSFGSSYFYCKVFTWPRIAKDIVHALHRVRLIVDIRCDESVHGPEIGFAMSERETADQSLEVDLESGGISIRKKVIEIVTINLPERPKSRKSQFYLPLTHLTKKNWKLKCRKEGRELLR